jgi:hypothetical protein
MLGVRGTLACWYAAAAPLPVFAELTQAYFTGKVLKTAAGDIPVTPQMAKLLTRYLIKHDYTDTDDKITGAYHEAKQAGTLAPLPAEGRLCCQFSVHEKQRADLRYQCYLPGRREWSDAGGSKYPA